MLLLVVLGTFLIIVNCQTTPCNDPETGKALICYSVIENVAQGRQVEASNTCGLNGAEYYYVQMGKESSSIASLRHTCDVNDDRYSLTTRNITSPHRRGWWQSQSMYDSDKNIQYPKNVTLTLDLKKNYEISYIQIKFKSPRPESMVIEKYLDGKWLPFQYFSSNCYSQFQKTESESAYLENENEALCTSKYSKITPLTEGNVIFSVLQGRPSNDNYENSKTLRKFTTAEKLRFVLKRLNTFGEELFGDPSVLRSYYYAISDIIVGGYCKCNGHGSNCDVTLEDGNRACECHHNTEGRDCEFCMPLYNNKPWSYGTVADPHECEKCNCNGKAAGCVYDGELGHGRCLECLDNTDGPRCEKCKPNYYRDENNSCVACSCHTDGSVAPQCDENGHCMCQPGVVGDKCDHCQEHFYGISRTGCEPCNCNVAGSFDNLVSCDPVNGKCACKENVDGQRCDMCKVGFMGLLDDSETERPDSNNEFGCTPCFCFEHSNLCHASKHFVKMNIESSFGENDEDWKTVDGDDVEYDSLLGRIGSDNGFIAPHMFTGEHRLSYNQKIHLDLSSKDGVTPIQESIIYLEGTNKHGQAVKLTANLNTETTTDTKTYIVPLHEKYFKSEDYTLTSHQFMEALNNIVEIKIITGPTILDNFILESARLRDDSEEDTSERADWVENCEEPKYEGRSCEICADGYTRDLAKKRIASVYISCVACNCHSHSALPCDPESGICSCEDNTDGNNCELCKEGYYGDSLAGTTDDCQTCPCPEGSSCLLIPVIGASAPLGFADNIPVVCTDCPHGSSGSRCEKCQDNFYGDPLGLNGDQLECIPCDCSGNIDDFAQGNCDTLTGECLQCLHKTEGYNCETCSANTWGDPEARKDDQGWKGCKDCMCHSVGTVQGSECLAESGQCDCKHGITGNQCDACSPDYYGFGSQGCTECHCDLLGSVESQCHEETGNCQCKNGVTGSKCDQCEVSFYGLNDRGCEECNCDPQGSFSDDCDETGACECLPGVIGLKCDKCAENHYDISSGCKKCDDCYGTVQVVVNQHRDELGRLQRVARGLGDQPNFLASDEEFDYAIEELADESRALQTKSSKILNDYRTMMESLSKAGHDSHEVQMRLKEFGNKLQECESEINNAKEKQLITEGTVKTLETEMEDVRLYLDDTMELLEFAKVHAEEQGRDFEELSDLTNKSNVLLAAIKHRSEEVQQKSQLAKETAKRAQQEVTNSMNVLNDLKNRLSNVQSNDVKSTVKRIGEAKKRAESARESAEAAMKHALDIAQQIENTDPPNLSMVFKDNELIGVEMSFEEKTKKIEELGEKLEFELQTILNKYNAKKSEFGPIINDVELRYADGVKLLNTADQLMAMAHAAKLNAKTTEEQINELFQKARQISKELANFKLRAADSSESTETGEPTNLDDLNMQLKHAQDLREQLSENVDSFLEQYESYQKVATNTKSRANTSKDNYEVTLDQSKRFSDQIDKDTKRVEEKLKESELSESTDLYNEKAKEITKLENDSAERKETAASGKKKADTAEKNLETIKDLVERLSNNTLPRLLEEVSFEAVDIEKYLKEAEDEYEKLRVDFAKLKEEQQSDVSNVKEQITEDNEKLEKLIRTKSALDDEVKQLEAINAALPPWCNT